MTRTHLGKWNEKRMGINIRFIDHKDQRYDTVGDWYVKDDTLEIRVSKLPDHKMELCIAEHEFNEAVLCIERGITAKMVDTFDMNFKGEGEPGDDVNAPYRTEHFFAETIERLLCAELGVDWQEYVKACDSV